MIRWPVPGVLTTYVANGEVVVTHSITFEDAQVAVDKLREQHRSGNVTSTYLPYPISIYPTDIPDGTRYVIEDEHGKRVPDTIAYHWLFDAVQACPPGMYVISKPDEKMCHAAPPATDGMKKCVKAH